MIETLPDGFSILKPAMFKAGFAADASTADAAFLRDAQVPINMLVFATKLKNAAWQTKPSWAIIATDDKALVFLTQPKAVAEVIEQAARSAGR